MARPVGVRRSRQCPHRGGSARGVRTAAVDRQQQGGAAMGVPLRPRRGNAAPPIGVIFAARLAHLPAPPAPSLAARSPRRGVRHCRHPLRPPAHPLRGSGAAPPPAAAPGRPGGPPGWWVHVAMRRRWAGSKCLTTLDESRQSPPSRFAASRPPDPNYCPTTSPALAGMPPDLPCQAPRRGSTPVGAERLRAGA